MAEPPTPSIEVGKLYRVSKTSKFVKAKSADFSNVRDWDFELLDIPKGSILMPVRVILSNSVRLPYLKVFSLWKEHIVYLGDFHKTVEDVLQLVTEQEQG